MSSHPQESQPATAAVSYPPLKQADSPSDQSPFLANAQFLRGRNISTHVHGQGCANVLEMRSHASAVPKNCEENLAILCGRLARLPDFVDFTAVLAHGVGAERCPT